LSGLSGAAISQLEQQGENENASAGQKNQTHKTFPAAVVARATPRSRGAKNGTTAERRLVAYVFA